MNGLTLVLLNGTCGSGKTTLAHWLYETYKVPHIEIDHIISSLKVKNRVAPAYNSIEVYDQVRSLLLQTPGDLVCLTSIFVNNDLEKLRLTLKGLVHCFIHIVLNPEIGLAIERTQERTCFTSKTPEEVTRFFHCELQKGIADPSIDLVLDNSKLSEEETGKIVLKAIEKKNQRMCELEK